MEITEAADQLKLKAPSLESVSTVDSTSLGDSAQDARSREEGANAEQPPTNSNVGVRPKSEKPRQAKTVSESAGKGIPASVKSRIRDLFWLQLQSREEIKETLKKELPTANEKQLFGWVESTLREETAEGTQDGNG